jgi:hypothetical protein
LRVTDSDDRRTPFSYALVVDSSGTIQECEGCGQGVYDYRNWQINIVEGLSSPNSNVKGCGHALDQDVKFVFIGKQCEDDPDGLCTEGSNGTIEITVTQASKIIYRQTLASNYPGAFIPIPKGADLTVEMKPDSEDYKFKRWEIWWPGKPEKPEIREGLITTIKNITEEFCLMVIGRCSAC